ncbi:hypothetical protein M422DRAFT_249373 [Sphaerobolus stellatus SS14]|uniref:F-box domain-containing protein n=1 Tax=Sphaerobolus stellatus (strain SS14) TaxID=990650 RepID=A0A0C9W4A7_SPHS4|nr:hypothetical protein M422DRAFT_249373 [Sphaerobolus stellatus SS14]
MLLDLPIDVVESIIDEIQAPSTLFSLALTCTQLSTLIIPYHLDSRIIQCEFWREDIWNQLLQSKRVLNALHGIEVASDLSNIGVRDFSVFESRDAKLEGPIDVEQMEAGIKMLRTVITKTSRLQKFICTLESKDIARFKPVFDSLAEVHGAALQELGVVITGGILNDAMVDFEQMLHTLTGLSRVSITSNNNDTTWLDDTIDILINHCPHLKSL